MVIQCISETPLPTPTSYSHLSPTVAKRSKIPLEERFSTLAAQWNIWGSFLNSPCWSYKPDQQNQNLWVGTQKSEFFNTSEVIPNAARLRITSLIAIHTENNKIVFIGSHNWPLCNIYLLVLKRLSWEFSAKIQKDTLFSFPDQKLSNRLFFIKREWKVQNYKWQTSHITLICFFSPWR